MESGRLAAGSSRAGDSHRASATAPSMVPCRAEAMGSALRLDPFSLPVRFTATDEAADDRLRIVDLYRERVVMRRSVRGMRMTLNLPVAAFRGVAIRLMFAEADTIATAMAVVLEHGDPALSLPLFSAPACDDIVVEWQSWGRVLGLPLLVAEPDGTLREPFARIGALRVDRPAGRRRRRGAIARRRPARLLRRQTGALPKVPIVHRNEREIIARN
jgi:hypothetical protein